MTKAETSMISMRMIICEAHAFIDILGFSNAVKNSQGRPEVIEPLVAILKSAAGSEGSLHTNKDGVGSKNSA